MATQFAGRLALISFATSSLRGLYCGADFYGTIQAALVSLGVFYVLGLVIGEAARRIVEENLRAELAMQLASASAHKPPAQQA